jgi:hypothetical protein
VYHENKKDKRNSSKSPTRAGYTQIKSVQDVEVKIESQICVTRSLEVL